VAIAVCALVPLAAAAEASAPGLSPGSLTAQRGPHEVKADLGTYCVSSEPDADGSVQSLCSDAAAPTEPPRPRLPVSVGHRVGLRLAERPGVQDEPGRLSAHLMRFRDNGRYDFINARLRPKSAGDREWTVRMPSAVRRADAIYVFVRLKGSGDASYDIGLK
jgi:hypothetical protein